MNNFVSVSRVLEKIDVHINVASARRDFQTVAALERLRTVIFEMTPADVVPAVRAKWIPAPEPLDLLDFYECSNCHITDRAPLFKFCPFCGARMDGESDVWLSPYAIEKS